jgi:predicted nucleic acid-binding protein
VDTNVFIHAQTHDALAEECLRFLEAVQRGEIEVRLEPMVIHELSYALPHYRKGMTRNEVSQYLLAVLAWKGITGEKDLMVNAVERWRDSVRLAFVDAYLAALAAEMQCPVFTKNVAELEGQGALVPNPLPERRA